MYYEIIVDEGKASLLLDVKTLREEILPRVNPTELKILLTIISYCNVDGGTFVSQRKIAEINSMGLSTVNRNIKSLLELEVNGEPLLKRELIGGNTRKKSNYSTDVTDDTRTTPKEFLSLYCALYLETFGVKYKVSGAKDINGLKSLMKTYTDEDMKIIIEYTIKEYSKRWSNVKYPTPTIGAMCSWIASNAMKIYADRKKVNDRIKEAEQTAVQDDEELIL